jgi:hypothetical protein
MKVFGVFLKQRKQAAIIFSMILFVVGNLPQVFAHGGEDHGEAKPKTTESTKGTVSHTMHIGDLEVMLKHPTLTPDTTTDARLFITKFETNEALAGVNPAIEIEAANGMITPARIEETANAGSFNVKFPALGGGTYTIRAKITYAGETDTATFSGVKVEFPPTESAENAASWIRTALLFLVGAFVLGLFGILFYFVWRMADEKQIGEETVSA